MDRLKKKALLDAMHIAHKRETEAFNFYQKALHKAPYPETRALLQQLAEEERKHRYFIDQELQRIEQLFEEKAEERYIDDQSIQFNIPETIPFMRLQSVPGIDLAAVSLPSELIGGDYLDTIRLQKSGAKTSLGVFLYDVMGHGMASTQLKASAKSVFGTLREDWGSGETDVNMYHPVEVMRFMNETLFPECQQCGRFITTFYGIVDMDQLLLRYTSAGHEPPILIRSHGRYHPIEDTDLLLGADMNAIYTEFSHTISIGDVIALFSDGMTEAGNPDEGMFNRHALCRTVVANRNQTSMQIVEAAFRSLKNCLKGISLTDDCSLAVVKIIE
jgi:sigma-B regulation protein RsbU (phosphoserine phosphatase)